MIVFSSAEFERAIRKKLNKPQGNIYEKELEVIKDLEVDEIGDDIKYLEYCCNLETLSVNLKPNEVSVIGNIKHLKSLELATRKGTFDCGLLAGLSELQYLGLFGELFYPVDIVNFDKLKYCNQLKEILIYEASHLDIHEIGQISQLQTVSLKFIEVIKNIDEIKNIKNLKYLDLCDISVDHLDFLECLDRNVYLELCGINSKEKINTNIVEEFKNRETSEMIYPHDNL